MNKIQQRIQSWKQMKNSIVNRQQAMSRSSFRMLTIGDEADRGHWNSRFEFMLSCIGLSVGLGNVWRFPVLAFENGGAAFLLPYIILQFLVGKPLYLMELVMGQFSGYGPVGLWRMNKAGKGIGVTMVLISLVIAIYYNIIMAYCIYYLFATFQKDLPWTSCKKEWLSRNCYIGDNSGSSIPMCSNVTSNATCKCSGKVEYDFDVSHSCYTAGITYSKAMEFTKTCDKFLLCTNNTFPPAHFYFYEDVIQISDSLTNIGTPIWYLALCLLLSWVVVFLCLMKGVKTSGKVVYFTATFPYLILLALLIFGCSQKGAGKGIRYYLWPQWHKLASAKVWMAAAGQMFFSLGVSMGCIHMFGSYNRFQHNVYTDSLIISMTDIITSFIAGFVVFAALGSLSEETGLPIEKVAVKGFGLAFVMYPDALSRMPAAHFWSALFFIMMFTLGLDSEFAFMETVLTCLQDEIPRLRNYKMEICGISCSFCFLIALTMTTKGGSYIINIMDSYGANYSVLIVGISESIAVQWFYGHKRFLADIKYMLGFLPHGALYWVFCWVVAIPFTLLIILLAGISTHVAPAYDNGESYEKWAQALGWLLTLCVVCPIPIGVIIAFLKVKGPFTFIERFLKASSPSADWGPQEVKSPAQTAAELEETNISFETHGFPEEHTDNTQLKLQVNEKLEDTPETTPKNQQVLSDNTAQPPPEENAS